MTQTFTILGIPKAQGRPRFARMGKFVRTYDPKESRDYKDNVAAQIVAQKPRFIAAGALSVRLQFHLPCPKSLPKKIVHHVKKPDIDNLIKAIFDSCKGLVWADDSMVCELIAGKFYTTGEPHVFLTVNELV